MNLLMKKILLVHNDSFEWSATIRAEALKKQWYRDKVDIVHSSKLPDGNKYDIIHFLYSGGITKQIDYILKNKHKVFTTLASERTLDLLFDKEELLVKIYKETVCCVCHNYYLLGRLNALTGQDNAVYIPNGVDTNLFNKKFVVGFVGAKEDKSEHKGLEIIKKACIDLDIELKIANQKDYKHNEIADKFYKHINCLIIASKSEGCNNPILEAMAMNIPVISTKVGIAGDLVGVIIAQRNVESLVNCIRRIYTRCQILEKYTWKIVAENYKNLYKKYERNDTVLHE